MNINCFTSLLFFYISAYQKVDISQNRTMFSTIISFAYKIKLADEDRSIFV